MTRHQVFYLLYILSALGTIVTLFLPISYLIKWLLFGLTIIFLYICIKIDNKPYIGHIKEKRKLAWLPKRFGNIIIWFKSYNAKYEYTKKGWKLISEEYSFLL